MAKGPVIPDKLERWPVDRLVPYERNARTHSPEQVAQIAASIAEFGFTNPILVASDAGIIAGHGRLEAAKQLGLAEVPVVVLDHLSDAQRRAYVLADNQLALNAGWDADLLRVELQELEAQEFDLSLLGFSEDELSELLPEIEQLDAEEQGDPDEAPEPPTDPVSKPGDVWLLGKHRVMCGDSTVITDVERLTAGSKAALLHADPPYGMGKASDGVANDNLYNEDLDAFQMEWWATFRPFLLDNASAYIWGNAPELWRLWYKAGLGDSERLTMRSQIIWDKPPSASAYGSPIGSEKMRSFPHGYEVCLFFMLGEQGFNNNADNYWDGWEPLRLYLESEMKSLGWKSSDLNKATGTFMGGHWVTKSQWMLPTAEQYAKIQSAAKGRAFKREHDQLKREFYATRAYFDNAHDNMTDVWDFGRVTGDERHGHATPKPVTMMERVMKSSLPKGGLCLEPFGGSGSTLIGAEATGRLCYAMELNPAYCDVIVKRWQAFTGKTATLESTGEPFPADDE
jgi:DNA modification methylase